MTTSARAHTGPLVSFTVLATALVVVACSREGRSPTEPGSAALVSSWSGSWTLDEASPAGDCLADELNAGRAAGGMVGWPVELRLAADGDSVNLFFSYPAGRGGFWPLGYAGTVDGTGTLRASVGPSWIGLTRHDATEDHCRAAWASVGGELSGTLSPDGRRLTGTVVESFRVVPSGQPFTIRSHFEATRR